MTPDHSPSRDEAEIDIGRYLLALWRHRLIVAAAAILCGAAGFAVSLRTTPVYEATAQLVVNRSKFGAGTPVQPAVTAATFKAMLDNQTVAAETVTALGLDKRTPPVTPLALLGGIVSSEVIPETSVIEVKVRLADPVLAARVANVFTDRAVQLSERMNQEDVKLARDTVKTQVDEASARLNEARAQLEAAKKAAQLEAVEEDVSTMMNQKGELATLIVDVETERARVKSAEEELVKQEPTRRAATVVDTAGALKKLNEPPDAARPQAGAPAGPTYDLRPEAISPYVNPAYEILLQQVVTGRTRLAALERRRDEIARGLNIGGREVKRLSEMYSKRLEVDRLEMEYDVARNAYMDAADQNEKTRLQVAAGTARLQRLDSAVPPDHPLSRHVARNAMAGFAVGLFLACLGVIAFEMTVVLAAPRRPTTPPASLAS